MRSFKLLLCGGIILGAAATSAEARPCAQTGFTLICRGHFPIQNHGDGKWEMSISRSPSAGGTAGATLAPGSCGWEDRPLNVAEPATIRRMPSSTAGNQGWFNLVSQCAFNDRCTVEVCVQNKSGALTVLSDHAVVRFPF